MYFRSTLFAMFLAVFGCTNVLASLVPPKVSLSYGSPALRDAISLQPLGEAQASALSSAAGASAASAKIDNSQRAALDRYGHEIGRPLLARPYGSISKLYAAALPPRSFVGQIDPVFVKDSYGNIKHIGEARIGVIAI